MNANSQLKSKHVLIVDDEAEIRETMIYDLKRLGCITHEASTGSEAFTILQNNKIDIVITDIRMPDGNGLDLIQQIRSMHAELPVVLITTGFSDLSASDAQSLGAFAIIEKPIDRKRMFNLLEQSCEKLLSKN